MEKTGLLESLHQTNTAKYSNLSLGDPRPVSHPTDSSLTLRRADPNVLLPGETIILLPLGGRLKENLAVKRRAGAADEKLRRLIRKPSRLHDEKAETQPCENRTGDRLGAPLCVCHWLWSAQFKGREEEGEATLEREHREIESHL